MEVRFAILLLALLSLSSSSAPWPYLQIYPPVNDTDTRTPLYFALMLSFGGDFASVGALPGVQIALDYINSEPSILPGYSLHYTLTDSQCNRTVAIDSFFREINRPPTKVGWVGSGCSVATEPTAELSQFFNITQLSCTSAYHASDLSYYFQLLSSSIFLSRGFFAIIKSFKWRRVSILTQNENAFVKITDQLKKYLASAGILYTEKVFSSTESVRGLGAEPFDAESRVYILAMYSPHAKALACEAHRQGVHYPTHQFLVFGWYRDGWLVERFTDNTMSLNCSLEERAKAFQYSISVRALDYNTDRSLITEGGLMLEDFEQQYREKMSDPVNGDLDLYPLVQSSRVFPYSQQCHESTLSLAKALHLVGRDLNDSNQTLNMEAAREAGLSEGETFTLANFSYSNSAIVQRMFHHLTSTNFIGITGRRVSFSSNRTRPIDTLIIQQHQPGPRAGSLEVVEIGNVPLETANFSPLNGVSQSDIFPMGVPSDGVPDRAIATVAAPVTVLFSILSVCGICFAVVCLVFNFLCRGRKLMVLAGTSLNYLINLGAIVLFLGVIIAILPLTDETGNSVTCNLSHCFTSIGFSLTNGTIAMKVIRIWYIHNRPKLNKKLAIRDVHIFVVVNILVVLDVIIIGLYLLIAGLRGDLGVDLVPNRENPVDLIGPTKKIIENYFYVCTEPGTHGVFSILIGSKVLLLVMALVFSLRTRKMKNKGQDEPKYIVASVYVMNVVSVVIIVSDVSLAGYLNIRLVVLSISHLLGTAAVLCLVFVPKMVAIYKDPKGGNVVVNRSGMVVGACRQYTVTTQDERELEGLRQRVKQLQDTLRQYGTEQVMEDDQEDEEEPQGKVVGGGGRVTDVQSSDDTGIDLRSIPNSHISRTFVTD